MTPFTITEALVRDRHQVLITDATRRRAARRARQFRSAFGVGPARTFAGRLLVRTGLRLAGAEHDRKATTLGLQARQRSDVAVFDLGAPAAPRRRAA